ncbi:hypothetical protein FocTR4_00002709, partial [Fusarium oxysporum f. sp. cubense]
ATVQRKLKEHTEDHNSRWVAEAVLATKTSKFEMVPAVGGSPNGGQGVKVSIVDS